MALLRRNDPMHRAPEHAEHVHLAGGVLAERRHGAEGGSGLPVLELVARSAGSDAEAPQPRAAEVGEEVPTRESREAAAAVDIPSRDRASLGVIVLIERCHE